MGKMNIPPLRKADTTGKCGEKSEKLRLSFISPSPVFIRSPALSLLVPGWPLCFLNVFSCNLHVPQIPKGSRRVIMGNASRDHEHIDSPKQSELIMVLSS